MSKTEVKTQVKKKQKKHIEDWDYFRTMNRLVKNQLSDDELNDLEEDIKTWELFRISELVGMGVSDIDGIPTPLLRMKMRELDKWDFNGGDDNKKYIKCFSVEQFNQEEDEKELHKSQGNKYKNFGEKYRTIHHQQMVYQIFFESELHREKK